MSFLLLSTSFQGLGYVESPQTNSKKCYWPAHLVGAIRNLHPFFSDRNACNRWDTLGEYGDYLVFLEASDFSIGQAENGEIQYLGRLDRLFAVQHLLVAPADGDLLFFFLVPFLSASQHFGGFSVLPHRAIYVSGEPFASKCDFENSPCIGENQATWCS